MTINRLEKAEGAYRAALRRAELLRNRRDAAIRRAVAAGETHAEVGRQTGLTGARVGQIVGSA